mmetsp:Transcript_36753/g.81745  ORF Transcript_36753/g.81745 Transcript_36753/m.81745 type:complete len:120 (-) Transcript_36753:600-959(-)
MWVYCPISSALYRWPTAGSKEGSRRGPGKLLPLLMSHTPTSYTALFLRLLPPPSSPAAPAAACLLPAWLTMPLPGPMTAGRKAEMVRQLSPLLPLLRLLQEVGCIDATPAKSSPMLLVL